VASGQERAEAAALLRRVLEAVERGELDAPPMMLAYLAGALASAETLSGKTTA